jgi:hypothetical protein
MFYPLIETGCSWQSDINVEDQSIPKTAKNRAKPCKNELFFEFQPEHCNYLFLLKSFTACAFFPYFCKLPFSDLHSEGAVFTKQN